MAQKKKTTAKSKFNPKKYLVLFWLAVLAPFAGIAVLLAIASSSDLPDTETLANPKTNLATEVYTSDDQVIGRYYKENRSDIGFENLPDHLVNALVATEDVRFWDHSGVDFYGLARAIAYMGKKGGGSTISQQLAKLIFTKEYEQVSYIERALLDKPKEWIIATRLEKQYTKQEIMALYLNRYDFLNQAVGIKSAANIYFNKTVEELTVEESAMLVGMLKNSSYFNPLRRPEEVLKRREVVLSQMVKYEFIAQDLYDSLRTMPLNLNYQRVSHDEGSAPYFREILRSKVKEILSAKDADGNYIYAKADGAKYDLYSDGLKIYTTLDSRLQEYAEEAVHTHLGSELQKDFWKDLKKRREANAPFYNGIKTKDKDRIMRIAVKQSERYKKLTGDLCPDCHRPAFYIVKKDKEGKPHFYCDAEKGGCGHEWPRLSDEEIEKNFETPFKTKIFTHDGPVDSVMTPMDSIRYHKSILHAGLMTVEPSTGHIKAWVGGIDYKFFQYDNVGQSRRQVGSTFKPFVYATAVRMGMHPCTELPNQKVVIEMPDGQPDWSPDNSDFKYGEMVTLEYALANSMNTITAKMMQRFSPDLIAQTANDMGIQSDIPRVPSIALGVAELSLFEITAANATFANKGVYIEPSFIVRIEDKNGNVVYEPEMNIRQGLDEVTAYKTLTMMKGVVDGAYNAEKGKTSGTGVRLRMDLKSRDYDGIKAPMAGKTGTTQNNTDGWFMGLTPELVTGVWVGAQDPAVRFSTTSKGQGANTALPIYGYYMKKAYADKKIGLTQAKFIPPEGIDEESLDCRNYMDESKSINFDADAEETLEDEELFE
ncbi:MAG: transglycosylase domain-containing protein [Flavobacteriales bacterium]|nr:transglycosylase domain-containing protein [Flavobacteriales bacterium]MDG1780848.1 transglycosylase domain-containing protein [Flavobacteriales bacterium]MDG2246727.1 transglycosylase domain-containing protein [Flavobacteriales bacterium]